PAAAPLVVVAKLATPVALLTIWLISCPPSAPVNVTVNGPPLFPVTDTLPLRAAMVLRLARTAAAVVPPAPSVTARGDVALAPSNDSVVLPLAPNVSFWTSLLKARLWTSLPTPSA